MHLGMTLRGSLLSGQHFRELFKHARVVLALVGSVACDKLRLHAVWVRALGPVRVAARL